MKKKPFKEANLDDDLGFSAEEVVSEECEAENHEADGKKIDSKDFSDERHHCEEEEKQNKLGP